MKVEIEGVRNPNNPVNTECLSKIETDKYTDDNLISFVVYDDASFSSIPLGKISGYLKQDKAGILITEAIFFKKDITDEDKEKIFLLVFQTVFNYKLMRQHILQISILAEHLKLNNGYLIHMGCIGLDFFPMNAKFFRLINPQYIEIIAENTDGFENNSYQALIEMYDNYQFRKAFQAHQLKKAYDSAKLKLTNGIAKHEHQYYQDKIQYLEQSIIALGFDPEEDKEITPKYAKPR